MKLDFQTAIASGIDFKKRRIYLGNFLGSSTEHESDFDFTDVTDESIYIAIRALRAMSEINSKPIELYINTRGGNITSMFGLYDEIKQTKCKVIGIGQGRVMSAGTLILSGCDERIAYPNTTFMFHCMSYGIEGKLYEHIDFAKFWNGQEEYIASLLEQDTGVPASFWLKIGKKDSYMTAQDALKIGYLHSLKLPIVRAFKKKNAKPSTEVLRKYLVDF